MFFSFRLCKFLGGNLRPLDWDQFFGVARVSQSGLIIDTLEGVDLPFPPAGARDDCAAVFWQPRLESWNLTSRECFRRSGWSPKTAGYICHRVIQMLRLDETVELPSMRAAIYLVCLVAEMQPLSQRAKYSTPPRVRTYSADSHTQ